MKNILASYLLFLLLALPMSGCKKSFLEITPKDVVVAQTVHDYDLLLNNVELLNTGADAQVSMGDEAVSAEPYFSSAPLRTQRLFRWDAVVYDGDQSSNEMTALLSEVYVYNKIINEVMQASGGTDLQKSSLKAEAQAGRAWCYFMLLNYYGKPYNATTAGTNLGFPIVTLADITQTVFKRGTLQQGYDFVISDLKAAIASLPAQVTARLRMSRPAALALLGKVYIFMGAYPDALTAFNLAFEALAGATTNVSLYDYNVTMQPGGVMEPGYFGPNYPNAPDNQEILYARQFFNFWNAFDDDILLSKVDAALYLSSDWRRQFFSGLTSGFSPLPVPGTLRRIGPIVTQFGVILPDILLLRAEAKARLNDIAGGKADLETLRKNRMPGTDAPVTTTSQADLIAYILQERIREFALQGYRWFDMRRIAEDPLFAGSSFSHIYYSDSSSPQSFTLPAARLTMRLPQKVISENPGMVNNE